MLTYIREEADNKVKELQGLKIPIYSISRLDTFETCKYKFFMTYLGEKIQRGDNIYSLLGSKVHSLIENKFKCIRNNESFNHNIKDEIISTYKEAEIMGYSFPSDKVKDRWIYNMIHFCNNSKFYEMNIIENELHFLIDIDGIWVQGFIDAIVDNGDNTLSVIDWKTSSAFKKEDLLKKGRQLVLYKIALENAGSYVSNAYWDMLKYVSIEWKNKSNKTSNKVCERREIIDKMYTNIVTDMQACGKSDADISLLFINNDDNNFNGFPIEISNKYVINDYLFEYNINEDIQNETMNYIKNIVSQINDHPKNDTKFWVANQIDEKNSFFCSNLCDVNEKCEEYKKYIMNKNNSSKKDKDEEDLLLKMFE